MVVSGIFLVYHVYLTGVAGLPMYLANVMVQVLSLFVAWFSRYNRSAAHIFKTLQWIKMRLTLLH